MVNSRTKFYDVFKTFKPIIGMIHLKGKKDQDKIEIAVKEIKSMVDNGIDAVLIENYFGDAGNVKDVLEFLRLYLPHLVYGVNILGDYFSSYELADRYGAKFIQVDSVAGHLSGYDDIIMGKDLNFLRETSDTILLGGVRFKYQPYKSGRSLEEDLRVGMTRCDGIVVTGNATGKETDLEKIKTFRNVIKSFPLVVGAGLTAQNCVEQLTIADAGIVGSYLKDTYKDSGDVSREHVEEFMVNVKKLRNR